MNNLERLYRYTTLPVALDILFHRQLTFLDPSSWDDKNDSYYMELYRKKKRLKSLLALCFTTKAETYHHWKVFADGISGVRIVFHKQRLMEDITRYRTAKVDEVYYLPISVLKDQPPETNELPFIKRLAFSDEQEFRAIYESRQESLQFVHLDISRRSIVGVTLSPWVPEEVFKSVKEVINSISGYSNLSVQRSSLIDNQIWQEVADRPRA